MHQNPCDYPSYLSAINMSALSNLSTIDTVSTCFILVLQTYQSLSMAFKVQSSLKLSRKGLVMEELIDDDLETLLIILEELSESDEIIVELLTVF